MSPNFKRGVTRMKLTGFQQRALVCIVSLGAAAEQAHGWGHQGHSIVARVGGRLTTKGHEFWTANLDAMAKLTNVPDNAWKRGKSRDGEGPNHWFQIDAYFEEAADYPQFPRAYGTAVDRYGAEKVRVNGTAPWRIHQFYSSSVVALKDTEFKDALELAGVMSHYIGDLSQPLHVTENYDGQHTGNKGIHKFFETDTIEDNLEGLEASVQKEAAALLKSKAFQAEFKGSLLQAVFRAVNRSIVYKDQLIETDRKYGRGADGSARQLKLARSRLADGAATLSIILSRLWNEGGQADEGASVKVTVPEWIPPAFDETATVRNATVRMNVSELVERYELHDDCGE